MTDNKSPRDVEAEQVVEEKAMIDHLVETFHSDQEAEFASRRPHSGSFGNQFARKRVDQ